MSDCSAGKPYCYDTPVHLDSADQHTRLRRQTFAVGRWSGTVLCFRSTGGSWRTRRSGHLRQPTDVGQAQLGSAGACAASDFQCLLRHHAHHFARRTGPVLRLEPAWSIQPAMAGPVGVAPCVGQSPMGRGGESRARRQHAALRRFDQTSAPTSGLPFSPASTPDFVFDIFVSRRSSTDEPFGPRVKLPPPINSDGHDYGPALTPERPHDVLLVRYRQSIHTGCHQPPICVGTAERSCALGAAHLPRHAQLPNVLRRAADHSCRGQRNLLDGRSR